MDSQILDVLIYEDLEAVRRWCSSPCLGLNSDRGVPMKWVSCPFAPNVLALYPEAAVYSCGASRRTSPSPTS